MPAGDDDCDGFTSSNETSIGTDPNVPCGPDAWPPDFDDSQDVSIVDVLALKPVFGQAAPPALVRYDIAASGDINIVDVLVMKPFFGESCVP